MTHCVKRIVPYMTLHVAWHYIYSGTRQSILEKVLVVKLVNLRLTKQGILWWNQAVCWPVFFQSRPVFRHYCIKMCILNFASSAEPSFVALSSAVFTTRCPLSLRHGLNRRPSRFFGIFADFFEPWQFSRSSLPYKFVQYLTVDEIFGIFV